MVGQDLIQVLFNVPVPTFQHYVQVPDAGHGILGVVGVYTHLGEDGVHPALGDQDVVGYDGFVVLPPAAEGEALGGLVPVYIEGKGEFRADLRLDAQQLQHAGVGGGLVGAFLRQGAFDGVAVHPVGLVGVGIAHFHMGLIEGRGPQACPESAARPTGR